jgi:protein subunit release factor A
VDFDALRGVGGVHKIFTVRRNKRQTCFVGVKVVEEVIPERSEIDWKKVRVDTFRGTGAGGQNINKTDSCVRMVYEGITVASRTERSQLTNRNICMKRLASIWADRQKIEGPKGFDHDTVKFGNATHQWWEQDVKKAIDGLIS